MNTPLLRRIARLESESLPQTLPRHFVLWGRDEQLAADFNPERDKYHRVIFGKKEADPNGAVQQWKSYAGVWSVLREICPKRRRGITSSLTMSRPHPSTIRRAATLCAGSDS